MKADYQAGRDRVVEELEKEFSILNICDVMDWIYWTFEPNKEQWEMSYEWECKKVKEFCENFGVLLYERPRSSFFKGEGIQMGLEGGWKGVILSDLS